MKYVFAVIALCCAAFGQGGAVLGNISFPSTAYREWHFALMSGQELPGANMQGWTYAHKVFNLYTTRDLCAEGCYFSGNEVGRKTKTKLDQYCWLEAQNFVGTFSARGVTTEKVPAGYLQKVCNRDGISLGGGDFTVELP